MKHLEIVCILSDDSSYFLFNLINRTEHESNLMYKYIQLIQQVNEVFMGAVESTKEETSQYTRQFWLFFMMMSISWIGQAVVVTFADAICFNLLGESTPISISIRHCCETQINGIFVFLVHVQYQ